MNAKNYRHIVPGHGKDSLSEHELNELDIDFDIDTSDKYILVALTESEWVVLNEVKKDCKETRGVWNWIVDEYKKVGL